MEDNKKSTGDVSHNCRGGAIAFDNPTVTTWISGKHKTRVPVDVTQFKTEAELRQHGCTMLDLLQFHGYPITHVNEDGSRIMVGRRNERSD